MPYSRGDVPAAIIAPPPAPAPAALSVRTEYGIPGLIGPISPPAGATKFKYIAVGASPGGGSGRVGAPGTNRCGGSGSGPGGYTQGEYFLSDLLPLVGATDITALRLYLNIAEGGAGGASVTTPDTNGNVGSNAIGGNTSIELRSTTTQTTKIIATGANGGRGTGGNNTGSVAGGTGGEGNFPAAFGGNGKAGTGDTPAGSPGGPSGGAGGSGIGTNDLPNGASPGANGAGLRAGRVAAGGLAHENAIAHGIWGVPGGGGGGGEGLVSPTALAINRRGGNGYRGGGGGGGAGSPNGIPSGPGGKGGDGYIAIEWN